MPQIDFHYTRGLNIDTQKIFQAIEEAINDLDSTAGACKSRAHCVSEFLHQHVFLRVAVLRKPHRDAAFMSKCLDKIEGAVTSLLLPVGCYYSVDLNFCGEYYSTGLFDSS